VCVNMIIGNIIQGSFIVVPRDRPVLMMRRPRGGWSGVRLQAGTRHLTPQHPAWPCDSPKSSIEWMPGSLSPGIKRPECITIQTPASNVTGKNECRYTWFRTVYLRCLCRDHMTSTCISSLNFLSYFHYTECNAVALYLCRFRELV